MTVKQLINKLKKIPEDATVYVFNDNMHLEGNYEVISSEIYYIDCDNRVFIGTDYRNRL